MSYHGELAAACLALEHIGNMLMSGTLTEIRTVIVHRDCMAAMNTVLNSVKTNYTTIMNTIKEIVHNMEINNIRV